MRILILAGVICIGVTTAPAAITGSAHDFSARGWNSSHEICIVCHTPHHADTSVADSPLWNHEVTTALYTIYSSPTMQATTGQPDGVSKLCLSCHDGTVALDSFGGTSGTVHIGGRYDLGTDLSGDHPISFTYDTSLATSDGELADPATALSGLGGTIQNDLLYGGRLECSSCHDVHNAYNHNNLLVIENAASALCLTCHTK
ncbi:MAG: cytochrome C [Acidobacteria bacterium]|nr:cytochrome C [Acidobacteriota bacterium]